MIVYTFARHDLTDLLQAVPLDAVNQVQVQIILDRLLNIDVYRGVVGDTARYPRHCNCVATRRGVRNYGTCLLLHRIGAGATAGRKRESYACKDYP